MPYDEDYEWEENPEEISAPENDIRKAGDYEIIHAIHVGNREVVVGENQAAEEGQKYLCAFCESNELFSRYSDCIVSDDYAEIVSEFGKRVTAQAEKTRQELFKPKFQGIKETAITVKDCTPITHDDNLENKIVVIKAEVLRREYRVATHQLKLCRGGFGAHPHSRGSACFCTDLYSGTEARYERWDILGTMKPEQLPEWAKLGLEQIMQKAKQKGEASKEAR